MNRSNRRRQVKRVRRQPTRSEELLKRLVDINNSETNKMVPVIPDVPRLRLGRNKIYTFNESYIGAQVASSATVETDGFIAVFLTQFGNGTAYTSLFDSYRIVQVSVMFQPCATPPSTGSQGPFYTAIDYDDSSTTALAALVRYDTVQSDSVGTYFERTYTPRIATAAYSGAFTSFAQDSMQWLDAASNTIIHYGLKYALPNGTIATPLWNITVSAVIQCRNPR